MMKGIKQNTQLHATIRALLLRAEEDNTMGLSLQAQYFRCLAGGLYLETKFRADIHEAGKALEEHVTSVVELEPSGKWFSVLYDTHSPVRCAIETLENVETVRAFLRDQQVWLTDLVELGTDYSLTYKL